ncbi:MAG: prepilin-type N-terminal cleavage/methylation domain-containing protein, partial [Deltaproteobacteria bacterium]|nr:prepilin-type N-terminal cleavage/methylation domain-containing protein [Deltaproteobacteria bacterium]
MLHNRNCSGFSLVEMAIVIIIIGIIISAVSLSMPGLISSAKVKKCEALIAKAAYVLTTQLSLSGRVPCPDTDGDGFENRIDGGTADDPGDDSCSSDIGSLPWQTMGIGAGDDMWGTALRYGVYADLVQGTALTLCSTLGTAVAASASCNTAKLHTTSGADSANQAFIIVSAGPDEALDGLNSGTDPGFEPAGRIPAAGYDDLSATRTLTGLYGKLCRGSFQPGVTSGTAGEETYTNGCENSTDDDGDGITDCLDQDCWGEDPCMVKITTDTLPSGTLNSSYATT